MNKKNRIFRSNTCIYEKKVLPLQSFLKRSLLLTLGMMMLNYESGRTAEINALHKYVKVNVDYSKDIIGLWEGIQHHLHVEED